MGVSYGGIPYFPHFTTNCDGIKLIQAQFGIFGYAVIFKLYERIYGGKGYYCEWNDDICLLFAVENRMKVDAVSDILKVCFIRSIFDSGLFERFGILTSAEIQETFWNAARKRDGVEMNPEFMLINPVKSTEKPGSDAFKVSFSERERELFERFGKVSSYEECVSFIDGCQMLNKWLDRLDYDAIAYALFACINKNKLNYSYLCGIMGNLRQRMETVLELIGDDSIPLPDWLSARKRAVGAVDGD